LVRQVLHALVLAARRRTQTDVRRRQLADRRLQALDPRLAVLAQVAPLFGSPDLLTLAFEEGTELLRELLHVDRLLDVAVATDRKRQATVAMARQHHDRTAVEPLVRPQPGGGFIPV